MLGNNALLSSGSLSSPSFVKTEVKSAEGHGLMRNLGQSPCDENMAAVTPVPHITKKQNRQLFQLSDEIFDVSSLFEKLVQHRSSSLADSD
jgi:hypothetical protein